MNSFITHTTLYNYDLAGRRSGNTYDALNRVLEVGTTSGIGYAYGPGTLPMNRSTYTYHSSMGATPIYATDSSNNVLDVKLGMNDDVLPTNSFTGMTVYDRDPFGYVAAARNSTGTSSWSFANLFSGCAASGNLGVASSGFTGTKMTSCSPSGLQFAFRTDGYFDGTLTFRGVRTYASDTQQWSTPDMYQGMATDPLSQMGYNYAGNNPAMFADPSGFCQEIVPPAGEPYPDPADPTCWLNGGTSSGGSPCLLYCQLSGGASNWYDAIGGSEIRSGVGMQHGGGGGAGRRLPPFMRAAGQPTSSPTQCFLAQAGQFLGGMGGAAIGAPVGATGGMIVGGAAGGALAPPGLEVPGVVAGSTVGGWTGGYLGGNWGDKMGRQVGWNVGAYAGCRSAMQPIQTPNLFQP